MDVILRNDPHVMDFNEYWNADNVYTESVGDKVKLVVNKIIEFIKSIIAKIQGMYANARLNHYKKMLKDPKKVEQLKQQKVAGWDTEHNKQLYAAGTDLMETTIKFFTDMETANSTHGIDGYIKTLEKKKSDIEALVQQTLQSEKINEMWTEYDALVTIIEESKQANLFGFTAQSFLAILQANKKGDLDSFYGQPGVDKSKVLDMFSVTGDACVELNKGALSSNAFYTGVSNKAGVYQGIKNYNTIRKKATKAMKEQGLDTSGLKTLKVTSINKDGTPVKESYELDELNAYIEYTMNDLHEALELRNELIQESDDDTVEDFEESDDNFTDDYEEADWWNDDEHETFRRRMALNRNKNRSPEEEKEYKELKPKFDNLMKRTRERSQKPTTEYYSDAIIRNYDDEPVEEETTYRLRSNDMFTESYDDESYSPSRFHQEGFIRSIQMAIDTAATINIAARVFVIVGAINTICTSLIYEKRLGRFPSEMKRVMDIIKKSKDGTVNTEDLYRALSDLKHATKIIIGQNAISLKAKKNFTQTEREEMKKMIKIISDLENMLTSKKYQAAERRVAARIEDFVNQADKVMKLINRGRNEGDVIKEYMS